MPSKNPPRSAGGSERPQRAWSLENIQELLDVLALHYAECRIRAQLRDEHPGHAALQGVVILLLRPVRTAVREREDGDAGPGVTAAALGGEHRQRRQAQPEQGDD